MSGSGWFLNLQKQYPGLLGATRLLSDVPEMWRGLVREWVREIVEAGAMEAGMRVESLSHKYDSLRANLVGRSMSDPRWDAFEVSLEDRSEAIAKQLNTEG